MKRDILKFGLLCFASFIFSACNDNFLERYPLDTISNETYWSSENDLKVYNNSLYNLTTNEDQVSIMMGHDSKFNSTRGSFWYQDEFSDNISPYTSRHNFFAQVRSGKQTVPSNADFWGYQGWEFVRAINVGLANYGKANVAQTIIDKYTGEARLLRGWFYADKVAKFGDVQWLDAELNIDSPELFGERTPRDQVMAKVLEDLNFACQKMPNNWGDGQSPGRLNRYCALLVKSRVCLFEGTWQKYRGGASANMWLQQAADAAQEIMNSGVYALYSTGDPLHDYNAYHRAQTVSASNKEVIYYIKYLTGINDNNAIKYHTQYNGGATKSMVEDYLCSDGLPISLSPKYLGDAQIEDVFVDRDPRLRQTILHPADKAYYGYNNDALAYPRFIGMTGQTSTTGYHIIKVYDGPVSALPQNAATTPALIMRFAEVLLNYSEAKAELGTITQADIDKTINKIRDRVAMPHLNMSNVPVDTRYVNDGVSPLIVEIRRERRVELFMEGFRYNDLKRWKQGKKLEIRSLGIQWNVAAIARYPKANIKTSIDPVNGKTYIDVYKGTDFDNPTFDENKNYLWPIQLSAIAQNPNIKQNPGWQ